jgi:hypothetical protein
MVLDQILEIYSLIKDKRSGLGLLELLIAIGLMAVPMTMIFKKEKSSSAMVIDGISSINDVFQKAMMQSLLNGKNYEIRFFFDDEMHIKKIVYSEHNEDGKADQDGKKGAVASESISIPDNFSVKKIIIAGKDESMDGKTKETWFLVYPEGYSQEIELHLASNDGTIYNQYKLNPFTCVFQDAIS